MTKLPRDAALYLLIFIEGYVVLSAELLAIRQLVPYVGSGIETVAVVIAAVLVPLALGYYKGGAFRPGKHGSTRRYLIKNFLRAQLFLAAGISYLILELLFYGLSEIFGAMRVLKTVLYSAVFLVYPVYLLGQTVPLLTNYLARGKKSAAAVTGRVLFFSTLGSFIGAAAAPLFWTAFFGVNVAVIVTLTLITAMILLLERESLLSFFSRDKKLPVHAWLSVFLALLIITINSFSAVSGAGVLAMTPYSTVKVDIPEDEPDSRIFNINNSSSAKIAGPKGRKFAYQRFIERFYLDRLREDPRCPCDILVVGAGGFAVGADDVFNRYVYIDIDKALLPLAETFFHQKKLEGNKEFVVTPARAYLRETEDTFDIILLDAFSNLTAIPPQLVTAEFFTDVKARLRESGTVLFNVILDPYFGDAFSVKIDNTFRTVFPHVTRQITAYEKKPRAGAVYHNVVYAYTDNAYYSREIYTDNKNATFLDVSF